MYVLLLSNTHMQYTPHLISKPDSWYTEHPQAQVLIGITISMDLFPHLF